MHLTSLVHVAGISGASRAYLSLCIIVVHLIVACEKQQSPDAFVASITFDRGRPRNSKSRQSYCKLHSLAL